MGTPSSQENRHHAEFITRARQWFPCARSQNPIHDQPSANTPLADTKSTVSGQKIKNRNGSCTSWFPGKSWMTEHTRLCCPELGGSPRCHAKCSVRLWREGTWGAEQVSRPGPGRPAGTCGPSRPGGGVSRGCIHRPRRPLEAAGAPDPRNPTPGCQRLGVSMGAGGWAGLVPGMMDFSGATVTSWGRRGPVETQSRMSVSKGTRW